MKTADIKLGMRVKRRSDESSFVRDRNPNLKGRRVGIIIGMPERLSDRHIAVAVQWSGSTRVDNVMIHRLAPLPKEQQPVALGGTWMPAEGGPFAGAVPAT